MKDKEKVVLVADYGRSGQGWLSFMLCYILNAKYIEPYDFLRGRKYYYSQNVIDLTKGNLPGREKTKYSMIIKTHEYPASDFNLTDKVIFLTRDPRDVAVSAYYRYKVIFQQEKNQTLKSKISFLIHRFKFTSFIMTAYKWRNHFLAWRHINYYPVRYEDLWLNPKNTLKGMLNYLEVRASDNLIEDSTEKFSFEKITGRQKGEEDLKNVALRKGIVKDYKNHFSKLGLIIFKFICGKAAKKAGYDL